MQTHRLDDFRSEESGKLVRADILMQGIHTTCRDVFAEFVTEMPVIVKQTSRDDVWCFPRAFGESGALQCVLQFRHSLPIHFVATLAKDQKNIINDLRPTHARSE